MSCRILRVGQVWHEGDAKFHLGEFWDQHAPRGREGNERPLYLLKEETYPIFQAHVEGFACGLLLIGALLLEL